MQQADDLALSSKWSITFHDPTSPELYASSLGAFSTISGFWQLYTAMLNNKILTNLPVTVNISIYRETASQCTKPWHGEWNIDFHHDTNPMRIYQQIILLVIGEQLTSQIRGLVLERRHDLMHPNKTHFSLSIFADCRDPDLNLKNILLSNNVISLDHCVSGKITFRPFQLLHIPTQSGEEQKDEEVMDSDIRCIKYSMTSLLKYKQSINNRSRGSSTKSKSSASRTGSHSKTGSVSRTASSRKRKHSQYSRRILPGFKHRESVLRLFGLQCASYSLTMVSAHDVIAEQLQSILLAEGCIVCMATTLQSPYFQETKSPHSASRPMEEEKSQSPVRGLDELEYGDSFLVAECSTLGCKHVAHCECIVRAVNHISIRGAHCSQFFDTVELSSLSNPEIQKEIGYHINTENVTGKIYNFSFRINHLISHNSKVSPQWPITVPSYFHHQAGPGAVSSSKDECLQIFFDNTELQIRRGTLQIAIAETKMEGLGAAECGSLRTEGANASLHTVNFEIPPPPEGLAVDPRITNKIYQLRYVDPATQQVLVVNINMKLKPNYALQLLSLRYEFNNTNNKAVDALTATTPSVCSEVASNTAPMAVENELLLTPTSISMMTLPESTPLVSPVPPLLSPLPLLSSLGLPPPNQFRLPVTFANGHNGHNATSALQLAMSALNLQPMPLNPAVAGFQMPVPLNMMSSMPPMPTIPLVGLPPLPTNAPLLPDTESLQSFGANHYPLNPPLNPLLLDPGCPIDLQNPLQLYNFVCTEFGIKYVCEKLHNPLYFSLFFENLKNFFPLLMMHHMGHTVCRSVYNQRHCTMRHKLVFLQSLALSFTKIASNRQGSFALICILSQMTTDSELQIINAAFRRLVACAPDGSNDEQFDEIILSQSGYHVVKKLVSFGHPHFDCIMKGIATDFSKYATRHYGVPIIRSILDLISEDEALIRRYRKSLLLFASHTPLLVCNQYGNYVIQQLLEISPRSVTDVVKEGMRGQFSMLAKHKFASNVVEKCLKHSRDELKGSPSRHQPSDAEQHQSHGIRIHDHRVNIVDNEQKEEEQRHVWVEEIVRELLGNALELINHKFGNYCLQTALTVAIEAEPHMSGRSGQRLLDEFVLTVSPMLNRLRLNVRKKWHQLLVSATSHNQWQWKPRGNGSQHHQQRRHSNRGSFRHRY